MNWFGNAIKRKREAHRLSQEELSTLIGVSRTNVANYESGKTNPPLYTAVKISKILNIDMNKIPFHSEPNETITQLANGKWKWLDETWNEGDDIEYDNYESAKNAQNEYASKI